ncbi:hypothetical protein B0A69_13850 [Chryseobacterium shigense]|nr:hypothetical protein B0A69_13850 [Chryseobacterium shigense]
MIIFFSLFSQPIKSQEMKSNDKNLSIKEKRIIRISSYTAKGDLIRLKKELNEGLNAGLRSNEIKEILVHTYAYCGFPRSIRGLQTFMEVIDDRKSAGIQIRLLHRILIC